eukprot:CAMPEP_0197321158 /NCGR_PEP_ID=MMETSP0891-20130614/63554_1 /TAXON_ID=44058 ORGANISM="Aureoumbra lagunensis, Strain CCMP1510" /NCGR_SAMPLE_ID=MMETSP0891 /ASSEMBLY_ACC=CAM_ASM_000534 /LENGTH=986 /DNA_ID=CAMNT_0042812883 /DNA_START=122 /DNA_END=3082 /DNA_ORIENTATION=+
MYQDLVDQGEILGDWDKVECEAEESTWSSYFFGGGGGGGYVASSSSKISQNEDKNGGGARYERYVASSSNRDKRRRATKNSSLALDENKLTLLSKDEKNGYWGNYDITTSLKPNLLNTEERDAAIIIRNAIRRYLAIRRIEGEKNIDEQIIFLREVTKIQKHARRILAQKLKDKTRLIRFKEQEAWKEYKEFLATLLSIGIPVLRWKHSANATHKIIFKVDKSRRNIVLRPEVAGGIMNKSKTFLLKDVFNVTKGYNSPFLRDLKTQVNPEKHLSLILRDSRRKGKETSIDLVFDTGEESDEGRVERDKFYANFRKLLDELEGDNAFFFSINGQYGRVSRSVFDRWERITLKSPSWRDQTQTSLLMHQQQGEKTKSNNGVPLVARYNPVTHALYDPLPLDPMEKPQNCKPLTEQLIYRSLDTHEELVLGSTLSGENNDDPTWKPQDLVAARWFSETIEIDYKDFLNVHRDDQGRPVPPKRLKERYFLQLCALPGVDVTSYLTGFANSDDENTTDAFDKEKLKELPRLPDGRYELQPQTLMSLPISKRLSHQRHESSLAIAQQPILIPAAALLPYFRKQVEKQFGELGIHGWRNVSTGEFEFDDENWYLLEDYALKNGGPKARAIARALISIKANDGIDSTRIKSDEEAADEDSTEQATTTIDAPSQDYQHKKRRRKKENAKKNINPARQIGKQRRELLRCLYGGDVSGQKNRERMYTSAIMTYNSSMKMKFEETQRKLTREATERKRLREKNLNQNAKLAGIKPNQKEEVISEDMLKSEEKTIATDGLPTFLSNSSSTKLMEEIHEDEFSPRHQKRQRVTSNLFRSHASVEMRRIIENKRVPTHNDDGFRFEIIILEKQKKPRKRHHEAVAKVLDSPVGLEVIKLDSLTSGSHDRSITFGHLTYPVALYIMGLADDTVPTVEIAYSNGNIRKGDIIVGVNRVFPNSAEDLTHLMKNSSTKRTLTLLRLTDPPDLNRILHNKKIISV